MRLDLLFTIREFPVNIEAFEPVNIICLFILYVYTFILYFNQTLDLAWKACHELEESEDFLEILGYILAIGNYLNAGTTKGHAYGFQLKYLPKVTEAV